MTRSQKLGLLLVLAGLDARAEPPVKIPISGLVQRSGAYCSGATPTMEQMAARTAPQPESGHRLLIRRGTANSNATPVAEVVTDRNGKFSVALAPGTYCVVGEEKRKASPVELPPPSSYEKFDRACFERAAKTCDAIWTVTSAGVSNPNLTFPSYCPWTRPCVEYHGSLPPAAAHAPAEPRPR